MKFVFSPWYIVLVILVAAIAACITLFMMMDKKDKELIRDFVKKNSEQETKPEPVAENIAEESKAEATQE